MDSPVTITTEDLPPEMDASKVLSMVANRDGKKFFTVSSKKSFQMEELGEEELSRHNVYYMTFCRHSIVYGTTDLFDWTTTLGAANGQFADFYYLSDGIVGVFAFDRTRGCLVQYIVELISPNQLPTKVICGVEGIGNRVRGQAFTVAIVRRTIVDMTLLPDLPSIGCGLIDSGIIMVSQVNNIRSYLKPSFVTLLLAANPLEIDQYPDRILTKEVQELSQIAEKENLWLVSDAQMINQKGIFFFLYRKKNIDRIEHHHLCSSVLGVLYFNDTNECERRLIPIDDKEMRFSTPISSDVTVRSRNGSIGFMHCCVTRSYNRMPDWVFSILDSLYGLKCSIVDTASECFGSDVLLKRVFGAGKYEFVHGKHYIYAVDLESMKFRRMPLKVYAADMGRTYNFFFDGAANGDSIFCFLPNIHDVKVSARCSTLQVTIYSNPSTPHSLAEERSHSSQKEDGIMDDVTVTENSTRVVTNKDYGTPDFGVTDEEVTVDHMVWMKQNQFAWRTWKEGPRCC